MILQSRNIRSTTPNIKIHSIYMYINILHSICDHRVDMKNVYWSERGFFPE